MIVARNVLNAKWGKGDQVVSIFKEAFEGDMPGGNLPRRILTDLSGQSFRVIIETQHDSLAAWEKFRTDLFSSAEFAQMFAGTVDLVDSGYLEIFTVEA
jgi:hypothetical protein